MRLASIVVALFALLSASACGVPLTDTDWLELDASEYSQEGPNGYRFRDVGTFVRLATARTLVPDGAEYCQYVAEAGTYIDEGDRVILNGRDALFYRFEGGRLILETNEESSGVLDLEAYNAVAKREAPQCRGILPQ